MSSTTLNSYLNCPRDFLYSHILQIPVLEGDGEQKNYGSAVHKTLEWAIKEANCHYKAPQLNLTAQFYP